MKVKISSKYQVVIPEDVRKNLNILPGTWVNVIAKGKIAYIVPILDLETLQDELKDQINHSDIRERKDRKV